MTTDDDSAEPADRRRIDKWLWHARFFRTRSLATGFCRAGKLRINSRRITKANAAISPGDVLTFPQGNTVRVVRVRALATRRGPAVEARELYEDLTPVPDPQDKSNDTSRSAGRDPGLGRPTKRERRAVDRLMKRD
ncbi:MAG: RNA-binding S4 domain-containing protein [Sphingomonadales bacterium]